MRCLTFFGVTLSIASPRCSSWGMCEGMSNSDDDDAGATGTGGEVEDGFVVIAAGVVADGEEEGAAEELGSR